MWICIKLRSINNLIPFTNHAPINFFFIENRVVHIELLLLVCLVNLFSYHCNVSDEQMKEWVEKNLEQHVIAQNRFKTVAEIHRKFAELKKNIKYLDINNEIEEFLMGHKLICIPAVF